MVRSFVTPRAPETTPLGMAPHAEPPVDVSDMADLDSADEAESVRISGFEGRVWCSSLADLVQLECLSSARAVVVVSCGAERGALYFDAGQVTHAVLGELSGDAAALELLSWEAGTFEQVVLEPGAEDALAAWPAGPSVDLGWQQLLMCAAQRRDEKRRDEQRGLTVRREERRDETRRSYPPGPTSVVRPLPRANTSALAARAETPVARGSVGRGSTVMLDANQQLLRSSNQEAAVTLAPLAAHLHRLTDLIARDLGAPRMESLVCLGAAPGLVVAATPGGGCVAFETLRELTLQDVSQQAVSAEVSAPGAVTRK